jgi:hypothetical protein
MGKRSCVPFRYSSSPIVLRLPEAAPSSDSRPDQLPTFSGWLVVGVLSEVVQRSIRLVKWWQVPAAGFLTPPECPIGSRPVPSIT